MLQALSRRDDRAKQVLSRLSALDPYGSVPDADPVETAKRLERLRYGTLGKQING
jgi:hypothetical protein